ncbi:MAG: hypothetical protein LBE18_09150 [Planctomycetaceae bacterium]|jgi:hypothetical protein|nr:hypothetical protein [Planctomycetaceae bacterium]
MAKVPIDVYRTWLKIEATNRPLNFYQLLRLKPFDDDIKRIRDNYRQLNAHVRKFASGEYIEESQKLLNELAKAMLCLTDSARKLEYDISLGRKVAMSQVRRSLEEILLANNIVTEEQMKQAKSFMDSVGVDLHEAVIQKKFGTQETVMLAYAESIGLPFVSIEEVGVDENIAAQINPNIARQQSFVPLMIDRGQLLLTSPRLINPDVEEELRMIFEIPVRSTICTPAEVKAAIAKYYPPDAVQLIVRKKDSSNAAADSTKQAKAVSVKKSAKADVDVSVTPMSEDEKKKRLQTTLVVFNFTVMIICVTLVMTNIPPLSRSPMMQIIVDGFIGVIVGAIAAMIVWNKNSK